MDDTVGQYAYRCLPMSYASQHGWALRAPYDVEVFWDGGISASSTQIICGRHTEHGGVFADNGTGNGIVTFHLNAIIRTPPGWSTWIMGGPNLVVPGAAPLSGVVETDWVWSSPTMNWKLTDPGRTVVFRKGDPVFFFFPFEKTYLEDFSMEHHDANEDPGVIGRYNEHLRWRRETESAGKPVFGKMYMRGLNPDGTKPDWPHTHKTKLHLKSADPNA